MSRDLNDGKRRHGPEEQEQGPKGLPAAGEGCGRGGVQEGRGEALSLSGLECDCKGRRKRWQEAGV